MNEKKNREDIQGKFVYILHVSAYNYILIYQYNFCYRVVFVFVFICICICNQEHQIKVNSVSNPE